MSTAIRTALSAILLCFGVASAQISETLESSMPLVNAFRTYASDVQTAYLPGYGLQIHATTFDIRDIEGIDDYVDDVVAVLEALSPIVSGLAEGDYVSIAVARDEQFLSFRNDEDIRLVIRLKPTQEDSLEVWLNGERRR